MSNKHHAKDEEKEEHSQDEISQECLLQRKHMLNRYAATPLYLYLKARLFPRLTYNYLLYE